MVLDGGRAMQLARRGVREGRPGISHLDRLVTAFGNVGEIDALSRAVSNQPYLRPS